MISPEEQERMQRNIERLWNTLVIGAIASGIMLLGFLITKQYNL